MCFYRTIAHFGSRFKTFIYAIKCFTSSIMRVWRRRVSCVSTILYKIHICLFDFIWISVSDVLITLGILSNEKLNVSHHLPLPYYFIYRTFWIQTCTLVYLLFNITIVCSLWNVYQCLVCSVIMKFDLRIY